MAVRYSVANTISSISAYSGQKVPQRTRTHMEWLRVTPLQIQPVASLLSSGGNIKSATLTQKHCAEEKHGSSLGIYGGRKFR